MWSRKGTATASRYKYGAQPPRHKINNVPVFNMALVLKTVQEEAPLGAAGPVVEAGARTQDRRFLCPVCGLGFTTKCRLQQHLLRKHAAAAEPIYCTCGQPFKVAEDRDAHMMRPIHRKRMLRYRMFSKGGPLYK